MLHENPASDITVRSASNLDREAVKELVFAVLAEYGLKGDSESTDKDLILNVKLSVQFLRRATNARFNRNISAVNVYR